MSTDHQDDQQGPTFDEAEQLTRFEQRLASVKVDRRMALQIFAAAGGALGLAACGSSNNNKNNNAANSSASNNAANSAAATKAPSAAASTAPATGGGSPAPAGSPSANAKVGPQGPPAGVKLAATQLFRWNSEQDADSHDFNKNLYCQGETQIWAGLAQFSPDLVPIPDIAMSWSPNTDGSVWTYKLRPDSKWTDGTPVTAKDFDYSFRRQLNPATQAPYASFLYDIKNAQAYNTSKITDASTLGIKVVDDQTIEFTLEAPAAYWPALTAYAAAYPANQGAVEKFGDKWTEAANIVSNGPFKLTKWDHNQSWEIAKHDGYWNAKNITLTDVKRPIIAAAGATTAYENNEIDWVQRVGPADYKRILADTNGLAKQVVKYFLDGTWYLVPEADKPPFDNQNVRLAMAHAVDRDTLIKTVLQGLGKPAFTFNPPGTPGFNPATYDEFTKFDPQKAKDQLKGTPYEGGKNWPKITMTQRTEGDAEAAAGDAIIQMLSDTLGMKIDHEIADQKVVYPEMYQRKLQLIWIRWYEDYPDPNDEQNLVFWSKAGGDSGHRQAWHDDNYDKLVVQAKSETDPKKRADLYAQADQILASQAGAIFVYYPQNLALLKPTIKGMPADAAGNAVPTWNIFVRMMDYLYVTA